MITKIMNDLSQIKEIKILDFNLGIKNMENSITIEVLSEKNYAKWNYFNEKVLNSKSNIKVLNRLPKIVYMFPINIGLDEAIVKFAELLNRKYYLIEKPMVTNLTIIAKITNCCNIDCQYCYDKPFRVALGHNGILEVEAVEKMMEMATRYAENVELTWHGGEPTLAGLKYYKRIYEEVLPKFPYCNITTSIQTNGTLLNEEWFKFAKKYNMDIGSSYNATSEDLRHTSEDNEYKTKENIDNVIENINKAEKEYDIHIGVIDVLTKVNHKDVKKIYEFYKDIGIHSCFNEVFNSGEAVNHNFLHQTKEEQKKYFETTLEYFKYWLTDKDKRCYMDRYASRYINMLLTGQSCTCECSNSCIRHYIGINSNGDIYPCDRPLPDKYRMGNIWEFDNFHEIYETKEYQNYEMERKEKLRRSCAKCSIAAYCKGGCPLIDLDIYNDASKANRYACQIRRLNLKAAYEALKDVNYEDLNYNMKSIISTKKSILPKEIPVVLEKLNISNEEIDLLIDLSDIAVSEYDIFLSREFKLFQVFNSPNIEEYLFEYDDETCLEDIEAEERIKLVVKKITNMYNNND